MYHRMSGNSGESWLWMSLPMLLGLVVLARIVYGAVRIALQQHRLPVEQ